MTWENFYLEYYETLRRERIFTRFCSVMYPTGWHHYGFNTVKIWALNGLKILGWELGQ